MTEVDAYQVEIEKGGQREIAELLISTVRGQRGKRKLFGEAYLRDAYHPRIYFKVQHAQNIEELFDLFMTQLIHRGYTPMRFRESSGPYWGDWSHIDLEKYDTTDLERARERAKFLT